MYTPAVAALTVDPQRPNFALMSAERGVGIRFSPTVTILLTEEIIMLML
jgi:hypothetical protein